MSKYLTREAILAAPDLQFQDVAVTEWGGSVRVRGMTGNERDEWEWEMIQTRTEDRKENKRRLRAKLVSLTVVDENGQRLFSEADIEALGQKSVRALQRVYNVAQRLSRISADDVEELAGN